MYPHWNKERCYSHNFKSYKWDNCQTFTKFTCISYIMSCNFFVRIFFLEFVIYYLNDIKKIKTSVNNFFFFCGYRCWLMQNCYPVQNWFAIYSEEEKLLLIKFNESYHKRFKIHVESHDITFLQLNKILAKNQKQNNNT